MVSTREPLIQILRLLPNPRGLLRTLATITWLGLTACVPPEALQAPPPQVVLAVPPGAVRVEAPSVAVGAPLPPPYQVGLATWYGKALAGHKTASGERFDPSGMTAAHRTLPLGTWVEVRRPDTGRTVHVRINDRGPFGDPRRVIDLSKAAADSIGLTAVGVGQVEIRVLAGP